VCVCVWAGSVLKLASGKYHTSTQAQSRRLCVYLQAVGGLLQCGVLPLQGDELLLQAGSLLARLALWWL
jgi:hypothetical protein